MRHDLSTPLAFLQTRRSARPRDLVAPGPDADQLETILRIASRIPDHGKLHPWRFVHVPRETRAAFAELLHRAYREERPDPGRLEIAAPEKRQETRRVGEGGVSQGRSRWSQYT